jgi:hypothetical protein
MIPPSTIGLTPPNPKVARSIAAEEAKERIPSGSLLASGTGPLASAAASITRSQRRTESTSQESPATQAAQCAATGLPAIRSSPSELSQSCTVVIRPATEKSCQ